MIIPACIRDPSLISLTSRMLKLLSFEGNDSTTCHNFWIFLGRHALLCILTFHSSFLKRNLSQKHWIKMNPFTNETSDSLNQLFLLSLLFFLFFKTKTLTNKTLQEHIASTWTSNATHHPLVLLLSPQNWCGS
jgi:hypothetical protein